MKEELRAEYWLKCWIAVANSSNSTNASSCTNWADRMLKDFEARFSVTPKAIELKDKEE